MSGLNKLAVFPEPLEAIRGDEAMVLYWDVGFWRERAFDT